MELAPFGIEVITLQPSKIVSKFGDTAARISRELIPQNSLYSRILQFINIRARASQSGATDATKFARRIVDAVTREKPPRLIRLGKDSWKMSIYKWAVPMKLMDSVLSRMFGLHILQKRSRGSRY
jgi:short-subunit dehydrogenase